MDSVHLCKAHRLWLTCVRSVQCIKAQFLSTALKTHVLDHMHRHDATFIRTPIKTLCQAFDCKHLHRRHQNIYVLGMRLKEHSHLAACKMINKWRVRLFGWHVVEMARQTEATVLQERLHGIFTAYQHPSV